MGLLQNSSYKKKVLIGLRIIVLNTDVYRDLWRRAWQPTPVFLSGESYVQRSLAGYSPWNCRGSDTTEMIKQAHVHAQGFVLHSL